MIVFSLGEDYVIKITSSVYGVKSSFDTTHRDVCSQGLRYHLCSSQDLFNFDFWVEEYQAVNVSVKIDSLISEALANGVDPRVETFCFCSMVKGIACAAENHEDLGLQAICRARRMSMYNFWSWTLPKWSVKAAGRMDFWRMMMRAFKSIPIEKVVQNGWHGRENYASDYASTTECPAQVATSSDGPGVSIAMAHSVTDAAALPAKIRKIVAERYDSRNPLLLLKRQFFHSHRVQPMEMDQVMSDRDSEDEVYDDIADLEDRREF
ncbi:putative Acyl-CoA N-acyltransferase with RING/FYVE/PHD-type zinc finger protein [Hibiscus syriacus]|uniref:Acyl-CoA N-acyltransferase with RING/FYVE/PHD-type zinc finger protein n=1 Tax=Hibiscus syriacus TaxID=106335 RepID=A0A6A2XR25_HIBSY|nr:putative Acyl-CoA N-acyltransferase with RING/FYVE/PHD-type zinc finger protein [Hibiscus syriacus]